MKAKYDFFPCGYFKPATCRKVLTYSYKQLIFCPQGSLGKYYTCNVINMPGGTFSKLDIRPRVQNTDTLWVNLPQFEVKQSIETVAWELYC